MGTGSSVRRQSLSVTVEKSSSGARTERQCSKPKIDIGTSSARVSFVDHRSHYNDSFDEDRPPCFSTFLSKSAIASSKSHMLRVMQDEEGKKAFEKFLEKEFPLQFKRSATFETNSSNSSTRSLFQDEINEFEIPVHSVEDEKDDCLKNYTEHEVLTKNMLDLKAWPLFLLSKEYAFWNKHMRKQLADKSEKIIPIFDTERLSQTEQTSFLKRIDLEFEEISKDQSWVVDLLKSVEGLPICVSIATASKHQHGFPLVYVNEYFEFTTGYTRESILGQNCRFLQTDPNDGLNRDTNVIVDFNIMLDNNCNDTNNDYKVLYLVNMQSLTRLPVSPQD